MKKSLFFTLLVLWLFCSCAKDETFTDVTDFQSIEQNQEDPYIVPGRLLVEFTDEIADDIERTKSGHSLPTTKSAGINALLESYGVVSLERVFPYDEEWESRHRKYGLHRFYYVDFDSSVPVTKAVDSFDLLPEVLSAEPERMKVQTALFNDPYLSYQWHYINPGVGSTYMPGADINVLPVWERYTGGSSEVIVCVEDGGVDLTHPDLAAVCIPGGPDGSYSFINGYEGFEIPVDSHGTHVAGTVAAINNNGIGVCGVAGGLDGNGGVRIMSTPILMTDPNNPDKTIGGRSGAAFVWAADHGAVISQNSWAYGYKTNEDAKKGYISSDDKLGIDYFIDNAGIDKDGNQVGPMRGGIVIFAAGNEAFDYAWPSMYERVVSVGAISSLGTPSYYTNYGSWVDICAPGGDVQIGPSVYSTLPNALYGTKQGTSMACPHVSGVAALVVSHRGGLGFTNDMLKECLLKGANYDYQYKHLIGPLVDALGAVTYGSEGVPEPVEDFETSVASNFVTMDWKVTADPDDYIADKYLLIASKNRESLENFSPKTSDPDVKVTIASTSGKKLGEPISQTIRGLEFSSLYYVAIMAIDYAGNYSELSPIKTVTTGDNASPQIEIVQEIEKPLKVHAHEEIQVQLSITDPDGHAISQTFVPGSGALSLSSTSEPSIWDLKFVGRNAEAGSYTAKIIATDEFGASSLLELPYTILPNHAPASLKQIDNVLFTKTGESLSLKADEYFKEEDGERIKYSFKASTSNVAHVYQEGENIVITALGYGMTTITLTASDGLGESVSVDFNVLVRDPSKGPEVSVKDNELSITTYYDGEVNVLITNSLGALVLSEKFTSEVFSPVKLDISNFAPGRYSLKSEYDGNIFTSVFVKK